MAIQVNKADWSALDVDQQALISTIISSAFPDQTIEAAEVGVSANQLGGFCTIGCTIAQAAAVAACGALPPGAKEVCVLAAQSAGTYCLSKC